MKETIELIYKNNNFGVLLENDFLVDEELYVKGPFGGETK